MTTVTYSHWRAGFADFPVMLRELINEVGASRVCDVGGGATAALSTAEVADLGLDYVLLDISPAELAKSPGQYRKICADIAEPGLADRLPDRFDLVHSHMLAEHVRRPEQFHRNVFDLLAPGGVAVHLMPTLWDPAFVANRLLPERPAHWLIERLQPKRRLHHDQAKFPAYYRWCRGPVRRHLRRFERLGYEVRQVRGFYGTGYADPIPGVGRLLKASTRVLLRHPVPALTSFCVLVLRKPVAD